MTPTSTWMPRHHELRSVRRAKRQALPIAFGERVRKPHHTMPVATVTEAIRVAKLVNGFGCRPPKEQGVRRFARIRWTQSSEGEHGDSAMAVGLAENEVEVRHVQVDVRHSKQTLAVSWLCIGEHFEESRRMVLAPACVIRRWRDIDAGQHDDCRAQTVGDDCPNVGQDVSGNLPDRQDRDCRIRAHGACCLSVDHAFMAVQNELLHVRGERGMRTHTN